MLQGLRLISIEAQHRHDDHNRHQHAERSLSVSAELDEGTHGNLLFPATSSAELRWLIVRMLVSRQWLCGDMPCRPIAASSRPTAGGYGRSRSSWTGCGERSIEEALHAAAKPGRNRALLRTADQGAPSPALT